MYVFTYRHEKLKDICELGLFILWAFLEAALRDLTSDLHTLETGGGLQGFLSESVTLPVFLNNRSFGVHLYTLSR